MSVGLEISVKKTIRWTPRLIKRLRGERTLAEFGALVGATANTIRRWEEGRVAPDAEHAKKLSELAEREHFLREWNLAGSGVLVGDLESASRRLATEIQETLQHRAQRLRE
jgi:transcriptional regulator with XRE-family HTH domain